MRGGDILEIIFKEPQDDEVDQIIVKCRIVSPELKHALNTFIAANNILVGTIGDETFRIPFSSILYIESVDDKTFLYGEKKVWESKQRLYELEDVLAADGFLRISKSRILSLRKIESFSPALSGRLKANLTNGEQVIVSRKYVSSLKKALGV